MISEGIQRVVGTNRIRCMNSEQPLMQLLNYDNNKHFDVDALEAVSFCFCFFIFKKNTKKIMHYRQVRHVKYGVWRMAYGS